MIEIEHLADECELNPRRLRAYLAELIRLREFAAFANRFRGRLPLKVREAFERDVPARSAALEWAQAVAEQRIEDPIEDNNEQGRLL